MNVKMPQSGFGVQDRAVLEPGTFTHYARPLGACPPVLSVVAAGADSGPGTRQTWLSSHSAPTLTSAASPFFLPHWQ